MTADAIANTIGTGHSRSAVIGKADRLGLINDKRAGRPRMSRPVKSEPHVALAATSQNERMGGMGSFKQVLVREALIDVPGYQCRTVPDIVALEPHQCRWPLDAGGFCGNDKYRGVHHNETSYCLTHLRMSINPRTYRGGYWSSRK